MVVEDGTVSEKATYSFSQETRVPEYTGHIITTSCLETGIAYAAKNTQTNNVYC